VQQLEGFSLIHAFDSAGEQAGIEQRLTKPGHPWTNGQVERMNRTLQDATVTRYDDDSHQQLKAPRFNCRQAYNFAKRLKTLHGLTPDEYIVTCWQKEPERFTVNPCHHTLGLNMLAPCRGLCRVVYFSVGLNKSTTTATGLLRSY